MIVYVSEKVTILEKYENNLSVQKCDCITLVKNGDIRIGYKIDCSIIDLIQNVVAML